MNKPLDFNILLGKKIIHFENDAKSITLTLSDKSIYKLCQIDTDGSDTVYIDEITGDVDDLINLHILYTSEHSPDGHKNNGLNVYSFYKLATIKGWVDVRCFCGSGVDNQIGLIQVKEPDYLINKVKPTTEQTIIVGCKYNPNDDWTADNGTKVVLVYLGKKGQWHQFKNIEDNRKVWCEVLGWQLPRFVRIYEN